MTLSENYSLAALNTLGFKVVAERFARVETLGQLTELLAIAETKGWPVLLLGGGSNLILSARLPGLVIQLVNTGIEKVSQQGEKVIIEAAAGQNWHSLVEYSLEQGWFGLENMALIPGTVGAAPIQNIGAYGVELKDCLDSLTAWDRKQQMLVTFGPEQCDFDYRWSRFKGKDAGRFIIWSVQLALTTVAKPKLGYGGLENLFHCQGVSRPTPQQVFAVICEIREKKLPNPDLLGNVGSFFENPIIPSSKYKVLKVKFPALVAFEGQRGFYKLAAGWLIEQAGWKGYQTGAVGVYEKQALVLVNRGNGDREQLMALAAEIQRSVEAKFGVMLQVEPRQYPA